MEIKLKDVDKYTFVNSCTQILKKEFEIGVCIDNAVIVRAYNICLDFYVAEFEKESQLIDSLTDVVGFMELYSQIASKTIKEKTPDDEIIMKRMLKFLFGELTKVDIKKDKPPTINDSNISRLWHLTNLIWELTQQIYTYYINGNTGCQFELYENYFGFTIYDTQFADKLSRIAEIAKTTSIGGFQSSPTNPLEVFFDTAKTAFGDSVVNDLINKVTVDDSPVLVNLDNISEKEFMEIISGRKNYDIKPRPYYEVVLLTGIFENHSNNQFLAGLTLRSETVNLKCNITHPHSTTARTRFRPILELHIDGKIEYCTTHFMFEESTNELITNQIPFDILPKEWNSNVILKEYAKNQKDEHSKWLEDSFENKLKESEFPFLRNVKSINGINLENTPSKDGWNVGEIDFIFFNTTNKCYCVVECKYLKSYYDFASFILDMDKFEGTRDSKKQKGKSYNDQLQHKFNWVSDNIPNVCEEFKNNGIELGESTYNTDCFFLTDSKTYYSFMSELKIIALRELTDWLN